MLSHKRLPQFAIYMFKFFRLLHKNSDVDRLYLLQLLVILILRQKLDPVAVYEIKTDKIVKFLTGARIRIDFMAVALSARIDNVMVAI